jgi:hypothetical protein
LELGRRDRDGFFVDRDGAEVRQRRTGFANDARCGSHVASRGGVSRREWEEEERVEPISPNR